MSWKGLIPAIAPKPRWLLSCARGSCGFWPACMVGSCCGCVGCADELPPERDTPLTICIVCEDAILYRDSGSSS